MDYEAHYREALASLNPDRAAYGALGLAAHLLGLDLDGAAVAVQLAKNCGHPEFAPPATDLVDELSWGQADWSGAAADHRLAIDSGGAEHAIQAAARLRTFDGQSYFSDEEIWAFRLIIESGHPNWSPAAALKLASHLKAMDDYEATVSAYRLALESGHPTHKPIAALNLGFLLEEQDDRVGAATANQVAIDSGDPDAAPMAAAALEQLTQDPR